MSSPASDAVSAARRSQRSASRLSLAHRLRAVSRAQRTSSESASWGFGIAISLIVMASGGAPYNTATFEFRKQFPPAIGPVAAAFPGEFGGFGPYVAPTPKASRETGNCSFPWRLMVVAVDPFEVPQIQSRFELSESHPL